MYTPTIAYAESKMRHTSIIRKSVILAQLLLIAGLARAVEPASPTPTLQDTNITPMTVAAQWETTASPLPAKPNLSEEEAELDAFLEQYPDIHKLSQQFHEDAAFRQKLAILSLSCETYELNIHGTVVQNVRFCNLPPNMRDKAIAQFIESYYQWLETALQNSAQEPTETINTNTPQPSDSTRVTETLDLSADKAAFDNFVEEYADLEKFTKCFQEDASFREKFARLALSCSLHSLRLGRITIADNLHFTQLPPDAQKTAIDEFIQKFARSLEKRLEEVQKPSWHGLSRSDIPFMVLASYAIGRQVRGADVLPKLSELVSPLMPLTMLGDIALGYVVKMLSTVSHELGHAITYRLFYGQWPKEVSIGTNDLSRPAIISLLGGKLTLRGLEFGGLTRCQTDLSEARCIPVFAAGGIFGIAGYYGMKKAMHALLGKPYAVGADIAARGDYVENLMVTSKNYLNGLFGLEQDWTKEKWREKLTYNQGLALALLPVLFDVAVWIQLKNVILDHENEGSDANCIATSIKIQLDKLWNAVAAKIKAKKNVQNPT